MHIVLHLTGRIVFRRLTCGSASASVKRQFVRGSFRCLDPRSESFHEAQRPILRNSSMM